MKEPFFNDVSITPLCVTDEEVRTRIDGFVDILEFCGFLGFKKVRFDRSANELELKRGYYLKDYLAENAIGNKSRALLLLNMLRLPYIENDAIAEDRYLTHTAKLKRDDREIEAEGLASAYFSNGFAVGFASEEFWRQHIVFTLSVTDDATKKSREHRVFCISTVSSFSDVSFINWSVKNLPLVFRPSNLLPEEKKVKLRDDHGKNELKEFASVIKKESYILEVVNSLPFAPKTRTMTKVKDDSGLIEIRLLDKKSKIGIVVQTTARNEVEAMYLAADIEKKYA